MTTARMGIMLPLCITARSKVNASRDAFCCADFDWTSVTLPIRRVPLGTLVPSLRWAVLVVRATTSSPTLAFFVSTFFVNSADRFVD